MSGNNKQLHWTQRVALVRHNLHAASRSGDFQFFKTLQANGLMEGTNHVGTLTEELGDEADIVLASMDNLNAGLAYLHQDAFKNVYDNLKNNVREDEKEVDKSKLYVDITMQRNMADMAIDKIASSALALIQQQPNGVQEATASVWITGATIVADCMEVALKELNDVESKIDDFIRLEESWNSVKASVVASITVLKGVFRLMDPSTPQEQSKSQRSSSIVSASGSVLRRLSTAFSGQSNSSRSSSVVSTSALPSSTHGRNPSVSSTGPVYRTPNYVRHSVSNSCPTSLPEGAEFQRHKLSVIPPTPASHRDEPDPFDQVPLIPEIPPLPSAPLPVMSMEQRRVSQAAF